MKQVVAIHGGDAFATHEEYLQFLKDFKIDDPNLAKGKGWKNTLQEALGAGYQVILPRMPNPTNAKYEEWKIWFEKYTPYLNDGVLLIGHSLGGSFLAKYLGENTFPKEIAATFLVAAPYGTDMEGMTPEFAAPSSLEGFAKQGGQIFLYQSSDDLIVPFAELAKYQAVLPQAIARTFTDRQHFNQDSFPEIVADIAHLP
jgi:predicted alpha/beta hydrolase family esterase